MCHSHCSSCYTSYRKACTGTSSLDGSWIGSHSVRSYLVVVHAWSRPLKACECKQCRSHCSSCHTSYRKASTGTSSLGGIGIHNQSVCSCVVVEAQCLDLRAQQAVHTRSSRHRSIDRCRFLLRYRQHGTGSARTSGGLCYNRTTSSWA